MSDGPSTDQRFARALGRDIESDLLRGVETGRLGMAMLDAGSMLSALADEDPGLVARLMQAASGPLAAGGTSGSVDREAVAFGLIDSHGRLIEGGERFRAWVGEPADSPDCRELSRRAAALGRATGPVRTLRHGVLATIAIAHDSRSPWPDALRTLEFASFDRGVLLVVFAPSRSRVLVERAAAALGLTPLQRRLAFALIEEPSLDAAARRLGIGRETAKDALDGALRKTGVRR